MKQPKPSDRSKIAFSRLFAAHGGNQASLAGRLGATAASVNRWAKNGLPRFWAEHAHLHHGLPYEPSDYQ